MELLPGLHQVVGTLGPRHFFQYLLLGERSLLVDTGIRTTPQETIFPYLEGAGVKPSALDFAVITHADVDHFGGNHAVKQAAPRCVLCCHPLDAPWVQSKARILRERYGWYEEHDLSYPPEVGQWLNDALGPDTRVDLFVRDKVVFQLADDRAIHLYHLRGHSPGHLALYDEKNQAAVITDAVLWRGLNNVEGKLISPPPYFEVEPYLRGIETLQRLDIQHLFTAHYSNMSGDAARHFLAESKAFVQTLGDAIASILREAKQPLTLREATTEADRRVGPYSEFAIELAGPVRAHLREWVKAGKAQEGTKNGRASWEWA